MSLNTVSNQPDTNKISPLTFNPNLKLFSEISKTAICIAILFFDWLIIRHENLSQNYSVGIRWVDFYFLPHNLGMDPLGDSQPSPVPWTSPCLANLQLGRPEWESQPL